MRALNSSELELLRQIARIYLNVGQSGVNVQTSLFQQLCDLCGTPCGGYPNCFKCGQVFRPGNFGSLLPDVCAPLFYAIRGTQSGVDVRAYKDPFPTEQVLNRIKIVFYFFLELHRECLGVKTGLAPSHVVAVPSGTGRVNHPLVDVLLPFAGRVLEQRSVRRLAPPRAEGERQESIAPGLFDVGSFSSGDHVVVVEDTWTTGANCLSVAVAVRQAGAGTVSVVPLARYLNSRHSDTAEWWRMQGELPPYDPTFCPVTRSPNCPLPPLTFE